MNVYVYFIAYAVCYGNDRITVRNLLQEFSQPIHERDIAAFEQALGDRLHAEITVTGLYLLRQEVA